MSGSRNKFWKGVPSYEGRYCVCKDGRVFSSTRLVWNGHNWYMRNGRFLKATPDKDGYLQIWLSKEGRLKPHKVHRLVAQAFIPNPKNKPEVNHKDGKKENNVSTNLVWSTKRENMTHSARSLGNGLGEKNPAAKLTNDQVRAIRKAIKIGCDDSQVAMTFRVNRSTISRIRNLKIWSHL